MAIMPGLTGIVGPNGCGKSNLVEALRWVMGESSAKRLRGGEMDDVIFAGAAGKPARNQAEVTLRLTNSNLDAPPLFNDSTLLEVTRKVVRGQGSAYRVNGRDYRAQDLKLLFADLASGASSNAMVAQGRVAAIVNARPTDRRALLEEAAGITGLYSRRREAELRLRAAEQNLERAGDLRDSKLGYKRSLDRQVGAARRYRELQEKRRASSAALMCITWQQAEADINSANSLLAAIDAECERFELAELSARRREDEANADLAPLRVTHMEAIARLQRLEIAIDALSREERGLELKRENLAGQLADCGDDLAREQGHYKSATERLKQLELEETKLKIQKAKIKPVIPTLEASVTALEIFEREASDHLSLVVSKLTTAENERLALNGRISNLEKRNEILLEELKSLSQIEDFDGLSAETIDEKISHQASLQAQLTVLLDDASSREKAYSDARELHVLASRNRQELSEQLARLNAEADGLDALLFNNSSSDGETLTEVLSVEMGFAPQVAAALGAGMAATVVPSKGDYWHPQDLPPGPDLPNGITSLANAVSAPNWMPNLLSYVGVAENAQSAKALQAKLLPGQSLTTSEGGLWRWDGLIIAADQSVGQATLIARTQRLEALRSELPALQKKLEAAKVTESSAEAIASEKASSVDALQTRTRNIQREIAELGQVISTAQKALADYRSQIAEQQTEQAGSQREQKTVNEELEALLKTQSEMEELDSLKAHVKSAQIALNEAKQKVQMERESLEAVRLELFSLDARLGAILTESFTFEGQHNNSKAQLKVLEERAKALELEANALNSLPDDLKKQRVELSLQVEEARKEQDRSGDSLASAEIQARDLRAATQDAVEVFAAARETRARLQAEQASAQDRIVEIARQAYDQFKCAASDLIEISGYRDLSSLPTKSSAEEQIARLERQIEQIGPVNLTAESEVQTIKAELEEIELEVRELTKAIAKLRKVIIELNHEGRERLKLAFDKVAMHFSTLFQRLFGGGKARIELVGSDDPLEAGLEIVASPPGKRLQTLSLLSGGEQTLTALALIFAMFKANPAPLCVLDEVDAPLDDANVDRMCGLLEDIASEVGTKFLIVTHNALTMARVDRLFGVTMAERGVSRLVSVNLAEASAYVD